MDLQKLSQDLEKVQSAVYLGQTEAAKTMILAIMYEVKVAQQKMHPTLLCVCRKDILDQITSIRESCPIHGTQSG